MQELAQATAAILAGGLGTRLRSAVADRPKVLAEVQGRPFLAYLLEQLEAAGVREAVLCTGYLGQRIRDLFGDTYQGLRLVYSQEGSPLGTGGALRSALDLLRSDTLLVMNGDSYCEVDLRPLWTWHKDKRAEATLVLAEVADAQRYGRVFVDAAGRVLSFEEKGPLGGRGWISAGIYIFGRRTLEGIPANGMVSLEREVFSAWVGHGLYGYRSSGRFLDIGTPEDYANAQEFLWFRSAFREPAKDAS